MKTNITPIPFTPLRMQKATGGELLCNNPKSVFKSVSINSRDIGKEALFVAIEGNNHDGHDFVNNVIESGIKGIIIDKTRQALFPIDDWQKEGITCLAVDNTVKALGKLALSQRLESGVKLIAITGSNGKTSTRAMTASIFETKYKTHATSGNFNNEIGLPLTLLKLGSEHEWAVVELGMNAPGEITRLADICRPDIGIITNAGAAHLEGLGTIENVARAKGELLPAVNEKGAVIINAALPLLAELTDNLKPTVYLFSDSESTVTASEIKADNGYVGFRLTIKEKSEPVNLNTPGLFMVSNALAAATAGMVAGLDIKTIRDGLENFSPVKGRINIIETSKGYNLIDDTYNANPDSMMAAITTLKSLKGTHRGIFVMGDMMELGKSTEYLHEKTGSFCAESSIEELYITGKNANFVADGARKAGMNTDYIFTGSKKEIINSLLKKLNKNDWVLVKGSRSMAMEDILKGLS